MIEQFKPGYLLHLRNSLLRQLPPYIFNFNPRAYADRKSQTSSSCMIKSIINQMLWKSKEC